jgi:hypothetical protein
MYSIITKEKESIYTDYLQGSNPKSLKRTEPGQQTRSKFGLYPVLQHVHVMDKRGPPPCKGRPFTSENCSICNQPYVPASHNYNLHEKRLVKTPPGLTNNELDIQRALATPINLKIVPDSGTIIALKKEVHDVLISSSRTQHTVGIICDIPVTPL